MQHEKLHSLQRIDYFIAVLFMLKETRNAVLPLFLNGKRLVARNFPVFENKRYTINIHFSLQFVELSKLHLVVYFVVLNTVIFEVIIIEELKCTVKKFEKNVIVESCISWTNRLYRMSQNNREH